MLHTYNSPLGSRGSPSTEREARGFCSGGLRASSIALKSWSANLNLSTTFFYSRIPLFSFVMTSRQTDKQTDKLFGQLCLKIKATLRVPNMNSQIVRCTVSKLNVTFGNCLRSSSKVLCLCGFLLGCGFNSSSHHFFIYACCKTFLIYTCPPFSYICQFSYIIYIPTFLIYMPTFPYICPTFSYICSPFSYICPPFWYMPTFLIFMPTFLIYIIYPPFSYICPPLLYNTKL